MAKGWISIHRQILECDIWATDEPYNKRDAWIYLLLKASRHDHNLLVKGHIVPLKRGEICASERYLATAWKWSRGKVKRYLNILLSLNMIEMRTTEQATHEPIISIVNYDYYQSQNSEDEPQDEPQADHTQTTDEPPTVPKYNNGNKGNKGNKNNNKAKPVRHKYGQYENVMLSDQDMEKLKTEFPKDYQERIERVSEYCKSRGKSYSDYLATIRSWARKEIKSNGSGDTGNTTADEEERRNREIDEYLASDEYREDERSPFE